MQVGRALPLMRLDGVSEAAPALLARFLEAAVAGGLASSPAPALAAMALSPPLPLPSSWEISVLTVLALTSAFLADFFGVRTIGLPSASSFGCFEAPALRVVFGVGLPSASSLVFGVAGVRGVFVIGLPSESSFGAARPRFLAGVTGAATSSWCYMMWSVCAKAG